MLKFPAYQKCQKGSVAIEAVFVLPLLILIGFGAVDGSLLLLQNHKVETGLVSAGNYLAKTTAPQNFESHAKRLATTGQITTGGSPILNNWAASDVTISYKNTANIPQATGSSYRGGNTIKVVQISTSIPFQGLGFIRSISRGSINISAQYEERLVSSTT